MLLKWPEISSRVPADTPFCTREIYPNRIREYCIALCASALWAANFIMSKIVPIALENIGWRVFLMFAVLNLGELNQSIPFHDVCVSAGKWFVSDLWKYSHRRIRVFCDKGDERGTTGGNGSALWWRVSHRCRAGKRTLGGLPGGREAR